MLKIMMTILLALFAFENASAQINLPKIFKPKPTPSVAIPSEKNKQKNLPAVSTSPTGGSYVDDGFTWFEAVSFEEFVNNARVTGGWALKSSIRLIGEFPDRTAFKMVVARAGKPVTATSCEGFPYRVGANGPGVSFVSTVGCWKKDTATKETGKFDVQVFAVNGETGAETLIRTYKIDVQKVDRVNGQTGKFSAPDAPHYVILRHAEAPVSFLFLRPSRAYTYFGTNVDSKAADTIEIYYSLSPTKEGKIVGSGNLRCSVDGKRLQMPGPQPYADQASNSTDRRYEVIYTDRLAAQYKAGGPVFKDEVEFTMVRMTLPLTFGEGVGSNRLSMKDYPGNWECSLMNNGETWRTWRWKVGSDGMPVKHAEQNGNINLYFNSYLIDTEIPTGGTILDKRLVPISAAEGLFYGQPWISAEGKAMAGKVPKKGNPFPIPSDKIK